MTLEKNKCLLFLGLVLGGCGQQAQTVGSTPTPTPTPIALATATPTPTPVPTVQIAVHQEAVALYIGGPQGIGYCAVYLGNTYCWDDGLHNAFLFFGAQNGLNSCNGACTSDTFATPRLVTANVQAFITANLPANRQPSPVMSAPGSIVDCTESAGVLSCPAFSIDTNQTGL